MTKIKKACIVRFPVRIMEFRMNNRYIIFVFIKTKVIFVFVLRKRSLQKEFLRSCKIISKMLVKVNYIESF